MKQVEHLNVQVFANREDMGTSAAIDVASTIKELLSKKARVRMVFAAAPSQIELLKSLIAEPEIDWKRVTVFHMDEYLGLSPNASQRFGSFLMEHLFEHVKPGEVFLIDSTNKPEDECRRYGKLINQEPIDIICLGIGENGHIAFNDPPVADFQDKEVAKIVELDEVCRWQQVNDGCFQQFEDVPTHAITLTIPTILSGANLFCVVPGKTKQKAIKETLTETITTNCPATILRRHPNCTLYVDSEAYHGCLDV
nr:glucosamine-6-phosphate deaminase [Bacillus timonensis]